MITSDADTTLLAVPEGTAVTSTQSVEISGEVYRIGEAYAFAGRVSADPEQDSVNAETDCLELADDKVWLLHTP